MPTPNQPSNSFITSLTGDQPVLVDENRGQLFGALLQEMAGSEDFNALYNESAANKAKASDDDEFWGTEERSHTYRPYNVTNGVLQIPVYGVLLNGFSYQFGRWATGYQYIERAFNRGMDDPDVKSIALIVDSPGGEVAGNFELVEKMVDRRGEKPIRAFAADHAYSAAYSISTAADSIVMSRSGGVGSIGVVVMHVEMSEMLDKIGFNVTFIFAGKHKVDGNSYEKLSASAKKRIQTRVDRIYDEFTGLVASNRGMEEQAVRDTEALTYDASDALEVGLADKVGALEEELAVFAEEADDTETEFMANTPKNTPAAAQDDGQSVTQADHDAAVASATSTGATGERERINAILDSDEGKARPAAALSAATKTSMTSDEAIAFLAGLPEEAKAEEPKAEPKAEEAPKEQPKAAGETPFNSTMAASGQPEVGAEASAEDGEDGDTDLSGQLLGALAMATGKKRKAA